MEIRGPFQEQGETWTHLRSRDGSSRITTVYHFLFVPLTIGLSALVAGVRDVPGCGTETRSDLRLTKFFGKLFLINFAMGVVTGIVQEFQFGMNWSDYSRFVGDIFGAPLAIEALLAFFLESTFLGLWIFGWDRLPEKLHAACIWIVHIGTRPVGLLHPGGELVHAAPRRLHRSTRRPGGPSSPTSWAVLTNKSSSSRSPTPSRRPS